MMHTRSIKNHIEALRRGEYSVSELATYHIDRAKRFKHLNCFIEMDTDAVMRAAESIQPLLKSDKAPPLSGLIMAHKDNLCTKRLKTTCASKMLEHYRSPFDATVVAKLDSAGAIMLGKTNLDEFAMGSSNETSFYGPVLNPWDEAHVAGGSSGGSAAAVASGQVIFATGSDTGGSIRQPAAFCGLTGLKPTYGRVSRYGLVAYASSLDQIGPITRSAEDAAYVLREMAGFDEKDATSLAAPTIDYVEALKTKPAPFKIGLPTQFLHEKLDESIKQSLVEALKTFEGLGAQIIPLSLQTEPLWVPCYYVIACAEASSNLSRFDGVRYGHRSQDAKTLDALIKNSRSEGFGLEVQRRILTGTHVLSAGYFEAYYQKALQVRRQIKDELDEALKTVNVILSPTTPTVAFKRNTGEDQPILRYLADLFTVYANLAGLPALSLPSGMDGKLPIGIQLIGRPLSEAYLLTLGHYFQQETDWHKRAIA